jgi:ADP-ribosylglycohydrolase
MMSSHLKGVIMLHGIVGDVIGSVYEAYQWKSKDLKLLLEKDIDYKELTPFFKDAKWVRTSQSWTDDTLCTLALYNAYVKNTSPIDSMVHFCKKYKNESIGFGKAFEKWLDNPKPYASYANGALMRIGFIPYLDISLEEKLKIAQQYTGVSHNHADCFQAVSSFIVLSEKLKHNNDYKTIIGDFLSQNNYFKTVEQLHSDFKFEMNAMTTLLQSCVILIESESYEELLKNAFYVGGDSDTLACIAGNLSSFVFELPEYLEEYALSTLKPFEDLNNLVIDFKSKQAH